LAAQLGRSELGPGWRDLQNSLERLKAVTADDVMRVAKTYFVKDNRTVGILVRKEKAKSM
jgi:zinc protease